MSPRPAVSLIQSGLMSDAGGVDDLKQALDKAVENVNLVRQRMVDADKVAKQCARDIVVANQAVSGIERKIFARKCRDGDSKSGLVPPPEKVEAFYARISDLVHDFLADTSDPAARLYHGLILVRTLLDNAAKLTDRELLLDNGSARAYARLVLANTAPELLEAPTSKEQAEKRGFMKVEEMRELYNPPFDMVRGCDKIIHDAMLDEIVARAVFVEAPASASAPAPVQAE